MHLQETKTRKILLTYKPNRMTVNSQHMVINSPDTKYLNINFENSAAIVQILVMLVSWRCWFHGEFFTSGAN